MSFVVVSKLHSIILALAGLTVIAFSVVLWFLVVSAPGRSAVSPDIDPLSVRLAFLAGLGWSLVGLGIGSRLTTGTGSSLIIVMALTGILLGGFMGLLALFVIQFSLTS